MSSRTLVDSPGDLPHVLPGAGQEVLQAEPAPLRHSGAAVEYEHLQGCAPGQQGLKNNSVWVTFLMAFFSVFFLPQVIPPDREPAEERAGRAIVLRPHTLAQNKW